MKGFRLDVGRMQRTRRARADEGRGGTVDYKGRRCPGVPGGAATQACGTGLADRESGARALSCRGSFFPPRALRGVHLIFMSEPDELPFDEANRLSAAVSQSSLLAGLNPEQLAAVTLPPQPALILAGAGSGKTRVLTTRIAWLVQTRQVSPFGVLAVTFTNKAAKEMLSRLAGMLPINLRGMWMGTFHGLCNRFLRTHYRDAALPQTFQILDSATRSRPSSAS